eukprot:668494-Prorocentrum_minimum.AAC.2
MLSGNTPRIGGRRVAATALTVCVQVAARLRALAAHARVAAVMAAVGVASARPSRALAAKRRLLRGGVRAAAAAASLAPRARPPH